MLSWLFAARIALDLIRSAAALTVIALYGPSLAESQAFCDNYHGGRRIKYTT